MLAAVSLGQAVSFCGFAAVIGGALVGLIFRGAASAWREERDAAVTRADRLEGTVSDQAIQIETLKAKVDVLEKRTNYDVYAERDARDHEKILENLAELTRGQHATTVAVEFLIKQVFPDSAAAFLVPKTA